MGTKRPEWVGKNTHTHTPLAVEKKSSDAPLTGSTCGPDTCTLSTFVIYRAIEIHERFRGKQEG